MYAVFRAMPTADPRHYVRGQYDGYREIDGVAADSTTETYAALRLEIDNWRWVGRAVLHPHRQAPAGDPDRAAARLQAPAAAGLPARRARAARSRSSSSSSSTRRTGMRLLLDAQRADDGRARADQPGHGVRRGGRRGRRRPTRCCCTRRWSATARASRARTASRRPGGSCSRCSTPRRRCIPYARAPGGRRRPTALRRRLRPLARARGWRHERTRTTSAASTRRAPQSAAAPSPFPPIADYAFLSDCHTGALVAPDGSIDWLCVPRFDSPSVFGTLLDREAGDFRFGPFGINVPAARRYEPGTNTLMTTWKTPTRLGGGPRRPDDGPARAARTRSRPTRGRRPTRTPSTCSCARSSASTATSRSSWSASRCSTTAACPAEWTLRRRRAATSPTPRGAELTIRLQHRHGARASRASRVRAPARALRRASGCSARCRWAEDLAAPADVDDAHARARRRRPRFWRDWLGRARAARPSLARADPALGAGDQGPDLHADRRDGRGADDVAARDARAASATGTTATRGCATRRSRCRRCTASTSTGRPTSSCSSSPTSSPTRTAALQIMYGIDGRRDLTESTRDDLSGYAGARPVRIGNGAFDQRQNDVFGAVLDSILLHTRRSQRLPRRLWPIVAGAGRVRRRAVWREPDQGIWEARGEPQHYVSSKLMCWVAMDRAAKLAAIRGDRSSRQTWARDRRGDPAPTSSSTASTSAACCASTTRPTRSTPRRCWPRSSASCPADDERLRATVLAIADELTENGFVLRYRTDETDDGLSGKEGTFLICSFWLVSALAIDRRGAAGARSDGAAAARSPRRSGCTPRSSTPTPAATSATSRRRSRTWR